MKLVLVTGDNDGRRPRSIGDLDHAYKRSLNASTAAMLSSHVGTI